jgi:hypothetical protein
LFSKFKENQREVAVNTLTRQFHHIIVTKILEAYFANTMLATEEGGGRKVGQY